MKIKFLQPLRVLREKFLRSTPESMRSPSRSNKSPKKKKKKNETFPVGDNRHRSGESINEIC